MNHAGCLLALAVAAASLTLSCSSARTDAPLSEASQVKAQPVITPRAEPAREAVPQAMTVDEVIVGLEQNERDHNLQAEGSKAQSFFSHRFRLINAGGWFSCDLRVLPGQPQQLNVTFGARRRSGGDCDVFIGGRKIATVRPQITDPNGPMFGPYDQTYPISPNMIQNKDRITVKFQALPESTITVVGIEMRRAGRD